MSRSIVAIAKGTNIDDVVEEALSHLGGAKNLIKPNSTVVLKPNAGHPGAPERSINTNPLVVAAVIKALRKAGPKEIIVAEASAIGYDTRECLESSGIYQAATEAGADRIIDIKSDKDLIAVPVPDARSNLTKVLLPRFLLEADHIVNLPIFKTHVSMVFSCALKNMKGVVQDKVHLQMHQTDLSEAIVDLWSVISADLSIADVIRPGEGFGPHSTIPVDFGCIVAGQDPVAVDATVCRMVGMDISRMKVLNSAYRRGIGNFEEKQIEIRGRKIAEVFKKLWIPYLGGFEQWPEYHIYAENACSSCQCLLAYNMERLKALGEYEKNAGITIVLGRKKELPKGVPHDDLILVGECLKKFRDQGISASGCPPIEPAIQFAIVDRKSYYPQAPETFGFDLEERKAREEIIFRAYIEKIVKKYREENEEK
jgi:uncharacterized protein (DUF362 family)